MLFKLWLKTKRIDQKTVSVSWIDSFHIEWVIVRFLATIIGAIGFIVGLIGMYVSPWTAVYGIAFLFGILFLLNCNYPKTNKVVFSENHIKHRWKYYPINQITRIDYSNRSQWTRKQPEVINGKPQFDPIQIRMWFNDDTNLVISTNTWQPQVNLRIRNALDNALQTVRKSTVEIEREEIHGKTGDYGLPDY